MKAAEIIRDYKDEFIEALILDAGKPYKNAEGEVKATIERLEKVVLDARRIMGEYIPGDWSHETFETEAVVKKEPLGVVLAISPFNYPLFTSATKIIPAMLAGNAVILKPSTLTPLAAIMLAKVLEEVGFPKKHSQSYLYQEEMLV